jgi:exopolysaccharide biosynthesis polyprenyl glycosylphosphotransferase
MRTDSKRSLSFRPSTRRLTLLILLLDTLLAFLVFNFVAGLRGLTPAGGVFVVEVMPAYVLMLLALYLIDGYSPRTDMVSLDYASQHAIALGLAAVGTLLLTFVVFPDSPAGLDALRSSRIVIVTGFAAVGVFSLISRRLVRLHFQRLHGARSILFIGNAASAAEFENQHRQSGMTQPLIVSLTDDRSHSPFPGAAPQPAPLGELLDRVQRGELAVEAIVIRESNREFEEIASERLLALYFAGVPTYTLELFHEVYWRKIPLYRLNQTWLFQGGFQIAREPVFARLKRFSDVILAALGLVTSLPVLGLAAIAIWIDDRGPVFFRQPRTGRNGIPFEILKLRTMSVRAEAGDPYTRPGDSRVTRIGRFLRASRIDEFPQLWNVLRGDMSLIGPRAEWTRLVADYERAIPCYEYRHLVKPGITGWAQVNHPYGAGIEDTRRKLEYDLYYIRHFSFLMDAAIVLKTIHVMLFGKGR